jgi:hypothetical protein
MRRAGSLAMVLFSAFIAGASAAHSQTFQNCGGAEIFADCTAATCTHGGPTGYLCTCKVGNGGKGQVLQQGVSIPPATGCVAPTPPGHMPMYAQSRYSPVNSLGLCTNTKRTWAQCMGAKCTVSADGKTASCPCTAATSESSGGGDYVIVTSDPQYHGQCTDDVIYSSATYMGQLVALSKALNFPIPDKPLWTH